MQEPRYTFFAVKPQLIEEVARVQRHEGMPLEVIAMAGVLWQGQPLLSMRLEDAAGVLARVLIYKIVEGKKIAQCSSRGPGRKQAVPTARKLPVADERGSAVGEGERRQAVTSIPEGSSKES